MSQDMPGSQATCCFVLHNGMNASRLCSSTGLHVALLNIFCVALYNRRRKHFPECFALSYNYHISLCDRTSLIMCHLVQVRWNCSSGVSSSCSAFAAGESGTLTKNGHVIHDTLVFCSFHEVCVWNHFWEYERPVKLPAFNACCGGPDVTRSWEFDTWLKGIVQARKELGCIPGDFGSKADDTLDCSQGIRRSHLPLRNSHSHGRWAVAKSVLAALIISENLVDFRTAPSFRAFKFDNAIKQNWAAVSCQECIFLWQLWLTTVW